MDYYVYAYLRKDRYTPYYIGKGKGPRWVRNDGRMAPVPPPEQRTKIAENLTEEAALELEALLIKQWGRKIDGGILQNIQEGGNQPPDMTGVPPSELNRQIARERCTRGFVGQFKKGEPSWISGKKQKAEWIAKRSKSIMVDGVEYYSQAEAARALGITPATITWRLKHWGSVTPPAKV